MQRSLSLSLSLRVLHQQQPEQNLMEIVRVVCREAVVQVLVVVVVVESTMLRGLMKRRHLLRRAWTSSDMSVAIAICQICSDKSPLNAIQINKLPPHVRVSVCVCASGVCVWVTERTQIEFRSKDSKSQKSRRRRRRNVLKAPIASFSFNFLAKFGLGQYFCAKPLKICAALVKKTVKCHFTALKGATAAAGKSKQNAQ